MPPRRSSRIIGSVVRTTTKVVRETVEVAVVESESQNLTQEPETAETPGGEELRRTILVEEKVSEQPHTEQASPKKPTDSTVEDDVPEQPQNPEESEDSEPKKPMDSTSQITEDTEDIQKKKVEAGEGKESSETVKKKGNQGRKRRRRRRRSKGSGGEGYKRYMLMVLKQVHPGMAISGQAMVIVNNLMNDMFERLAEEAARLSKYTGGRTLSWREIQGAVRLVLPGELGKHAAAEGTKAVSAYVSHDRAPKH